jgi:hypothetical protein
MAFSFDRNVAKVGNPTGVKLPIDQTTGLISPISPENTVRGMGAKTSGEVDQWVFGAGAGPAFTFEAFERRLRVRPSVEWMRQEIRVSGVLNKTFQTDTGETAAQQPGDPTTGPTTQQFPADFLDPITIRSQDTQFFNGIGPGLELEMDAARAGPVMLSLFLSGQAYKMLGDLSVHLEGQSVVPAQAPYTDEDQSVNAGFDFHLHSWAYHGGLGLRFRWLPGD